MKLFPYGITHFIRKGRRIDGGWHIAIARHLQIFVGTTDMLCDDTKAKFARVYDFLFHVHASLRLAVRKEHLGQYQQTINDLLDSMVEVCAPSVKSKCNSIKYHWPRHWADTRRELGCSAAEKSLERKLGEIQKKNFRFSNSRYDVDVSYHIHVHWDVHFAVHCNIHCYIHSFFITLYITQFIVIFIITFISTLITTYLHCTIHRMHSL